MAPADMVATAVSSSMLPDTVIAGRSGARSAMSRNASRPENPGML